MDRVSPSRFKLSLLGRFELTGETGTIDLPSKKLAGLLAFLVCTAPQAHSRDKLMTLLWGSHFEAQARQNLRQALFRLRRVLGSDAFVMSNELVSLSPGLVVCDVARFQALVQDASHPSLGEAVNLYRDQFLADIAITEEPWTEWLTSERQRLEGLALDAMVKLGERELEAGRHEQAHKLASRALTVNNLHEGAHRLVMRALAASGRRTDALKYYEGLIALLKRELGVEPDPGTQALADELRKPPPSGKSQAPPSKAGVRPRETAETNPMPEASVTASPTRDRPSIAVLPFANLSGDPEQEYFADGIVEDILSALSRVHWLFVIARQSSFSYRGRAIELKQIGRELGVRYVIEGSVRKDGERVRLTAQLINAETEAHIWAERYERRMSDIFALQDEITERIVTTIEPSVRAVEIKRARAKPTESLTAYDLYLRALPEYHAQTEERVKRAETLLHKAIEQDPEYAEALGTLAECIALRTLNGWHQSVSGGREEACEAASRALAAGPDNSTCLASAAFAYAILARRFEEALELAQRAVELHPNSVFVRNRVGAVYGNCGESDKAITHYEAALRMNPRDPKSSAFTFTGIAFAHFFARRFEECVHWGKRAMAINPSANIARRGVAAALAHLGRIDEAKAEIKELLRQQPNLSMARERLSSLRHEWMYALYLDGLLKAGLRKA
jgi:TolB-like protein/two-component SAPR family response regulator